MGERVDLSAMLTASLGQFEELKDPGLQLSQRLRSRGTIVDERTMGAKIADVKDEEFMFGLLGRLNFSVH
jgi:hypothetical protein